MGEIFNILLYQPIFNALIWLYNLLPFKDLGVAIIILTVIIRVILYPLSQKAIVSQKKMSQLQPKIKEVQKQYKEKEEQARKLMELYRENKINPASGCLPILVQLPILIALYRVFSGLNPDQLNWLYGFIEKPVSLNLMFLGLINLSQRSIVLSILAGVFQFIQSKMLVPKINQNSSAGSSKLDFASLMNKQMLYFMPLLMVFICWQSPAALALYLVVITLFGIVQQYFTK